jgi:predicted phosphodiesterase
LKHGPSPLAHNFRAARLKKSIYPRIDDMNRGSARTLALLMTWLFLVCPVPAAASGAESGSWSFVVFGDTRDATQDTRTGISPFLGMMAKKIASENPALVIHIGDLINGYYTTKTSPMHGKYNQMFYNWKAAVKPIYDFERGTGIPLYVVRGNHEDGKLVTDSDLKNAYLQDIAPFMPQNGPEQEKGLSYSISHRQVSFFAVDEYSIKELGLLRGLIDQPWLTDQLSKQKKDFKFVFGHVPAYKVANASSGPFPDLYSFPRHRDAFWERLKEAGVTMYLCGHVHFYCRVTKDDIQQVLIGNGGAEAVAFDAKNVDPDVTINYPTTFMSPTDINPGYVIFTVDGKTHTVSAIQKLWNLQTGEWKEGDTFTIRKKSPR